MSFAPSGRFQLVDSPALPGKCAVCGYAASGANEPSDRRQYIDFGMEVDFYGVVYICTTCFHDVAVQFGYALPEEVDNVRAEAEQVKSELARMSSATEVINGLANVLVSSGWIAGGVVDPFVHGEAPVTEESEVEGPDDSEPVKSVDEPGPDDVRDSLGLDL